MQIELACKECGTNRFVFPGGGGDEGIVTCGDCGHVIGSMGALKEAYADAVIQQAPVIKLGEADADNGAIKLASSPAPTDRRQP